MKTPCQEDPEMWVSDFASSRREAARLCNQCPAFDWCVRETIAANPKHGIWAGKDYSKDDALSGKVRPRRPGEPAPRKVCAQCGGEFERSYHSAAQWERQVFCSTWCSSARFVKAAS